MIPEEISSTIEQAESVILFTHVHPDGDALGSLFGFGSALEALGKKVFRFLQEPVPYLYDFLPECEKADISYDNLVHFIKENQNVIAISLDCGDCERLGANNKELIDIDPFIVIDHHRSHKNFGTNRWVDFTKSSTGEMVYELITALGADISYECAYNLYVAISTDTGSFKYESTSPNTLRIAADLMEKGVKPDEVSSNIHNNYTLERLRLMQSVLATLSMYESDQLAFIHVKQEMVDQCGALQEDIEGFIDLPRSIKSVKVAAFIKETNKGTISVSLRAKGECDVAAIAKTFGGGGHRNASGFRFSDKDFYDVYELVLAALKKAILKQPPNI